MIKVIGMRTRKEFPRESPMSSGKKYKSDILINPA